MADSDVPRDDDLQTAEPPPSPARAQVLKWLAIWDQAGDIQAETGRSGTLDDWEGAWDFSNHIAGALVPALLDATRADLRAFIDLLASLEWVALRLESLAPTTTGDIMGALLAAAGKLRTGLGMERPVGPVDIRDLFPEVDPRTQMRLDEQDAKIDYWADVASARAKRFATIEERMDALEGCCPPATGEEVVHPGVPVLALNATTGRVHGEAMHALALLRGLDLPSS